MTVRGRRTQPLPIMAIQITHKNERGTDILSLHVSLDVSKQSKIRTSWSGFLEKTEHIIVLSLTTNPKYQHFATTALKFRLMKC